MSSNEELKKKMRSLKTNPDDTRMGRDTQPYPSKPVLPEDDEPQGGARVDLTLNTGDEIEVIADGRRGKITHTSSRVDNATGPRPKETPTRYMVQFGNDGTKIEWFSPEQIRRANEVYPRGQE